MEENEFNNPVDEMENTQPQEVDDKIEENDIENLRQDNPTEESVAFQKLKDELEEQKDKYIRLFAEFDNYKRRTSKEAIELRQTAGKEIIISLLDVLDDIDRAEKQLQESETDKTLKEGIMLVF
jgi:molecular chaperone GrpE